MAELLLELLSEEIPARMQAAAAQQLHDRLVKLFEETRLGYERIETYVTPRRLTAIVTGLPQTQEDNIVERKGPKIDAPIDALEGFLRSSGLSKDQLEIRNTPKGDFYFAVTQEKGRKVIDILAVKIGQILVDFHWPKSMRWYSHTIQWVRPLHRIVCLFDGQVVPCSFGHIQASNISQGHRFLSPESFTVFDAAHYLHELKKRFVILDPLERKNIILSQIEEVIRPLGILLKSDQGLLEEVTGLVEYPVVILGKFERHYMGVPKEALISAMRMHQKYFSLQDAQGNLVPYFIGVANIKTSDDQAHIKQGFERVLTARLEDARFFWEQDCKIPLEARIPALKEVIFHAQLGSLEQKIRRVAALAKLLGIWIPKTDLILAERAALLSKTDLVTNMVGEFPELQGIMGYHYALENQENVAVALAIKEHYAPQGPQDNVPTAPLSVAVALADKIDTLVGLFAAGEIPTGSKDPYALRRASLGIIRIILANSLRIPLTLLLEKSLAQYPNTILEKAHQEGEKQEKRRLLLKSRRNRAKRTGIIQHLLEFMEERLKFLLKDQGVGPDLIQAVFDEGEEDDLTRLKMRVEALQTFLATLEGQQLLAAYRRASNIVDMEEKRDDVIYSGAVKEDLLQEPDEKELYARFTQIEPIIHKALKKDEFTIVMQELSTLYQPINQFFDRVIVNSDNADLRENRLLLLAQFQKTLQQIADFSVIQTR